MVVLAFGNSLTPVLAYPVHRARCRGVSLDVRLFEKIIEMLVEHCNADLAARPPEYVPAFGGIDARARVVRQHPEHMEGIPAGCLQNST